MALSDNRHVKATAIYGHTESLPKLPRCLNLPRCLTKGEKIKIKKSCAFFPSLILSSPLNSQILKKNRSLESLSFIIHGYWECTVPVLPSYMLELQLATEQLSESTKHSVIQARS